MVRLLSPLLQHCPRREARRGGTVEQAHMASLRAAKRSRVLGARNPGVSAPAARLWLKLSPVAKLSLISPLADQAAAFKQTSYKFRRGKDMLQKRLLYVFSHTSHLHPLLSVPNRSEDESRQPHEGVIRSHAGLAAVSRRARARSTWINEQYYFKLARLITIGASCKWCPLRIMAFLAP